MRYLTLSRLKLATSLFIVLSTCAALFYAVHIPAQAAGANASTHITLSTLTDHPLAKIQITGTGFGSQVEPEVANGVVYYTGQFSIMFAFDVKSGQLLWTFNGSNGGGTDPTIVNGMVYSGLGGSIYAFHLAGSAA